MCPDAGIRTMGAMITTEHPTPTTDPSDRRLVRAGGTAALVTAASYVVGFVALGAFLIPAGYDPAETDPTESLSFLLDHQAALHAWYLVLYLVGGAAMAVVALGVGQRLRSAEPALARVSTTLGTIWSGLLLASGMIVLVGQQAVADLHATDPDRAATVWSSVQVIADATGGGIELVGGLWALVVGWAALRTGLLPRGLCRLGLVIGAAGVLTVVPGLAEPSAVLFGLGFIAWFSWAGLVLRRR